MKKSTREKIIVKLKKRLEFIVEKIKFRAFEVKKFYVERAKEVKFSGVAHMKKPGG